MERLLLIDDDVELCELVREFLEGEGFEVDEKYDGVSGLEAVFEADIALVVLDVMLPRLNGFEVLRRIRENSSVPVIMLTARGEDVDRIVGLEMGADDYLAKPFNPRELAARIRAILRRIDRGGDAGCEVLAVADVRLDCAARQVTSDGREVVLTGVEFQVLEILMRAAGQVVSRNDLSRAALGRRASSLDRSLDVHVSNLRRKLGLSSQGTEPIKTVRGVGYVFARPPVEPA